MKIPVFVCDMDIQAALRLKYSLTVLAVILDSLYVEVHMLDYVGLVVVLPPALITPPHCSPVRHHHAAHQTFLVANHTNI